ncbi:protein stoned-B [Drosophila busckii]|uniref:protein stoned-B n=1 Tax=Drosophila busckii TaxID=30019 RepID=UPI001432B861|nr:protein stoned-B [Drosophila busckii]
MANPFLMDDSDLDGGDLAVNPFLLQSDPEPESTVGEGENPFGNPFAFASEEPAHPEPDAHIDVAMSFFGTTIEAEDDALSLKSAAEDDLGAPPRPQPPPIPPTAATQQLINTVASHMEETSSELLGRIPATRSPSPVSMRDLHSPSPTPDSGLADLLDVDADIDIDASVSCSVSDSASSTAPGMDNPFGVPTAVPNLQGAAPVKQLPPAQPPRPPPPRPAPPRPTPPAQMHAAPPPQRPPPPAAHPVQPPTQDADDLLDMFGNGSNSKPAKPPPPKSKEDILSLFEQPTPAPAAQPKPDLLGETNGDESDSQQQTIIFNSLLTRPDDSTHDITSQPQAATHMATHMAAPVDATQRQRAPTPDIEITTVEDLPRSDDEDEPEPTPTDVQPTESAATGDESEQEEQPPQPEAEPELQFEAPAVVAPEPEPEQMDTALDFPALQSGQLSANPFASPEEEDPEPPISAAVPMVSNIFAVDEPALEPAPVEIAPAAAAAPAYASNIFAAEPDEFDAFSAKFDSVKKDNLSMLDGFGGVGGGGGGGSGAITPTGGDAWGDSVMGVATAAANAFGEVSSADDGFGNEDDDFYAMQAPVRSESVESVDKEFSVVIRPKVEGATGVAPQLAPPPPPARNIMSTTAASPTGAPVAIVNPFEDVSGFPAPGGTSEGSIKRTDSQDTPQTPLYDEDVSQPLEEFPRLLYIGPGWEMQLRQPNKKKITGQRFWKKIFVRLVIQNDVPVVQLLNQPGDKQAFQELPLQPSYSVSEIGAQQYDQFGKIFTMKLQYIFYKERPGVRPGQVTKAERITNKLTKFAQYAIAGDYEGVKEFGSDLKKLGLPVEHAPQSSQLFKIGSMNYEDMKQFSVCIEEALFKLPALRERALTYKMEEVQVTAVDEIIVEQDYEGKILKQIARVRLFFLAFLTGMPTIELGVNDMWRQGKEVVGRHDIIPVATEEWIRLEAVEFHSVVQQQEYERTRTIKFQPPDANYIELLRFRVRPPKNRELPLQLKATWCVTGNKVELRADILVPGFTSRKLGQIPCEDVSVRFPIPECWIYLFRVEKHFRYGSVKSAHRRTGKIKGIERILGAVDTLQESLIEVTSGQAKYEHHHRAIVWRCPRLPKEGQGAYTTHQLVCRMALTSYDQIPSELAPYAFVEFTMPATQVSHTTVRSVSVQDSDADEPPEKYVRYLARHEYKVGIETTHGESTNAYLAATRPIREEPAAATTAAAKPTASPVPPSDSDSDSN